MILAELERHLRDVEAALKALEHLQSGVHSRRGRRGKRMSAAARRKISEAQKQRWAKFKKEKSSAS
jgi:hypothetical protein